MAILTFRRIEKKYIITEEQKSKLQFILLQHMKLDEYCQNGKTYHIQNIYFDTPHQDIIRYSLEKPVFKEKIRLRKYAGLDEYYLEIKKKLNGVVGKRRVKISFEEMKQLVFHNIMPVYNYSLNQQNLKEIDFFYQKWNLKPCVFISYDRYAYFDKNDKNFRITFDKNICSKKDDFSFDEEKDMNEVLDKEKYILEIKSTKNFPVWLCQALSQLKIFPHSFSKYGTDFKNSIEKRGTIYESII